MSQPPTLPPSQWTVRVLLAWLTPFLLILAAQFIPQDPDADSNMFGPLGLRQDITKWLVVGMIPLQLLLAQALLRRCVWLAPSWLVGFGLAYLASLMMPPGATPTRVVGVVILVAAPLVGWMLDKRFRWDRRPQT